MRLNDREVTVAIPAVDVIVASTVAGEVDDVAEGQTQPPVAKLVTGGTVQVAAVLQVMLEVYGADPEIVSAFTKTGMTAPVAKAKTWWPKTLNRLAPSPEWVVILKKVSLSFEKTSSRTVLDLISLSLLGSALTPLQSSSSSVKPASMG